MIIFFFFLIDGFVLISRNGEIFYFVNLWNFFFISWDWVCWWILVECLALLHFGEYISDRMRFGSGFWMERYIARIKCLMPLAGIWFSRCGCEDSYILKDEKCWNWDVILEPHFLKMLSVCRSIKNPKDQEDFKLYENKTS